MTSSNITRLNLGKRNLNWCTLSATVSCQLITACVCANLSNKHPGGGDGCCERVKAHDVIKYHAPKPRQAEPSLVHTWCNSIWSVDNNLCLC